MATVLSPIVVHPHPVECTSTFNSPTFALQSMFLFIPLINVKIFLFKKKKYYNLFAVHGFKSVIPKSLSKPTELSDRVWGRVCGNGTRHMWANYNHRQFLNRAISIVKFNASGLWQTNDSLKNKQLMLLLICLEHELKNQDTRKTALKYFPSIST